jgi:hypothetical protein
VQRGQHIAARIALAALTLWALLMIVPDFYRVAYPLASAGFAVDNDGLVYDVTGPFAREEDSPAWRSGLRLGDRLDLHAMQCSTPDEQRCADLLAMLGGMGGAQLVWPGRALQLQVIPGDGGPARALEVAAKRYKTRWLDRSALFLNEIIATLFVLAAAWLVWTRPGAMTWGFFLYAIWFNSGQDFVFYAFLQGRPRLLLAQEALGAVMEGVGYAGFLLFVLQAPSDRSDPHWRNWRFALPLVALVSIGLQLLSYANVYGMPSEITSRASFLFGFAVDAAAILILLRKRRGQPPQDYQRLRWILWGCVIGLPAFLVAALLQSTTLWRMIPGLTDVPPDLIAALYFLHGAMAWFVFEAVRRPRVVSVSIPLRRITVFGLMLSVPALFLHQQIEPLNEWLHLPDWGFFALGVVLLFLIGRAHEISVEFADHVFNRAFRRKVTALRAFAEDVLGANSLEAVEAILVEAPLHTLDLASAALFRRDGAVFKRCAALGWPQEAAEHLDINDPALLPAEDAAPFAISPDDAARLGLPIGLAAPTLAAPVADRLGCHALALYGPHAMGADLSRDEGKMLARLASAAALAYRDLGAQRLREQIAELQALAQSDAHKR